MKVDEHMDYTFTTFKEDDRSRDSKHYRQVMPYFLWLVYRIRILEITKEINKIPVVPQN